MVRQRRIATANCKDCNEPFNYSIDLFEGERRKRGHSDPERCPTCRRRHNRAVSSFSVPYLDITNLRTVPEDEGVTPGVLGKIETFQKPHKEQTKDVLSNDDFGITEEDIRRLLKKMMQCQVVVVEGPTGSGKSTFLANKLLEPPTDYPPDLFTCHGQIVITQPRIVAAQGVAEYVASDLYGTGLGQDFEIGYMYSKEKKADARTKMVFMTDGLLVNKIIAGELSDISVIMIDEAHERSLNIDIILSLLKMQLHRYPYLKVIIASATIDTEQFINFFGGRAQVGFEPFKGKEEKKNPEGKVIKYERYFHNGPPIPPDHLPAKAVETTLSLLRGKIGNMGENGDILVFLDTRKKVKETVLSLKREIRKDDNLSQKVAVYPLHRELSNQEKELARVKTPSDDVRKVVVATNIAETSITIDGLTYVVDSGLILQPKWDPARQDYVYESRFHSQAGCRQRWGRVGRSAPGEVFCLYTEEQYEKLEEYTVPEIQRACLDQVILTLKAAGVDDITTFPWIDPPDLSEINRSIGYLTCREALDEGGDITEHGLELRNYCIEVKLGDCMVVADKLGCAVEMATFLPMLKIIDRRRLFRWDKNWDMYTKYRANNRHKALVAGCQDDLEVFLKIFASWLESGATDEERKDWADRNFINHSLFAEDLDIERKTLIDSLSGFKKEEEDRNIDFGLLDKVRLALLRCLPENVCLSRNDEYVRCSKDSINGDSSDEKIDINSNPFYSFERPEAFIYCRKISRKVSSQSEAQLFADIIIKINPAWLPLADEKMINFGQKVASITRDENGELKGVENNQRFRLSNLYPIHGLFRYEADADSMGKSTDVVNILGLIDCNTEVGESYRFIPERQLELLDEQFEVQGDDLAEVGDQIDAPKQLNGTEEDELDKFLDEGVEDELHSQKKEKFKPCSVRYTAKGRLEEPSQIEGQFFTKVVGYDFESASSQVVMLSKVEQEDPFAAFASKYDVGDDIMVMVLSKLNFPHENLLGLLVAEPKTGLEIIVEHEELSLGKNSDFVKNLKIGEAVEMKVMAIDVANKRVSLSTIPFLVRERGEQISAQAKVKFVQRISAVPEDFEKKLNELDLSVSVNFAASDKEIAVEGTMSMDDWLTLRSLSDDLDYQRGIDYIFRQMRKKECKERLPLPAGKIGLIIGKGGRTIRSIEQETNTSLYIRKEDNTLVIQGCCKKDVDAAIMKVNSIIGSKSR